VLGGALVPSCASHGDTAHHTALPGLPSAGRPRRVVTAFRANHQPRNFLKASVALVPPNPNALLSATSTSCLRAWFGT